MWNVVFQILHARHDKAVAAVVVLQMGLGRQEDRCVGPMLFGLFERLFHQLMAQALASCIGGNHHAPDDHVTAL
ncbi:hypothetical protein D3C81_2130730 [compost metagenome]